MERYETALEYVGRSLPIIPLVGKRPAFKNWQAFLPDARNVREWFKYSNHNIGLRTDEYAVIDTDTQEAEQFASQFDTPMIVRTGSGNRHRFFDGRGMEIRNKVGALGIDGLDFRAKGGFVVFPCSTHPETGKPYLFETQLLSVEKLPKFPMRLMQMETNHRGLLCTEAAMQTNSPLVSKNIDRVRKYIRKIVAVAGQGGHKATYRAACKLADAGLTEEEVLGELIAWNQTNAIPPWDMKALEHKARDAIKRLMKGA